MYRETKNSHNSFLTQTSISKNIYTITLRSEKKNNVILSVGTPTAFSDAGSHSLPCVGRNSVNSWCVIGNSSPDEISSVFLYRRMGKCINKLIHAS